MAVRRAAALVGREELELQDEVLGGLAGQVDDPGQRAALLDATRQVLAEAQ